MISVIDNIVKISEMINELYSIAAVSKLNFSNLLD